MLDNEKQHNRHFHWHIVVLGLIVLVSIVARFYDIERADVITDESAISFRSIGYLDFLGSQYQTTPIEWSDHKEWWMSLSFHDHPPLNFMLQHLIFRFFGVSVVTLRLLPVLAGVLSVFMTYAIGRRLFNDTTGLLAAALLAVNDYHIWISRLALQESVTILFILFSVYIFLRSLDNIKLLYAVGVITGLAVMVKLNVLVLVPIFGAIILIYRREIVKTKEFVGMLVLFLITISPYLVYNIFLYEKFGHFDFQLSYLLGQDVEAWQIRPGRQEFPTLAITVKYFFINVANALSPVYLVLSLIGSFIVLLLRKKLLEISNLYFAPQFLLITLVIFFGFILFIGPSRRFLTMLVPWLSLLIATGLYVIIKKYGVKMIFISLFLILIFSFEIIFSTVTIFTDTAYGREGFLYATIRQISYPYGYNSLEPYIADLVKGKKPSYSLPIRNAVISQYVNSHMAKNTDNEPAALMMIYDPRMYREAMHWTLNRRLIYEGWPVIDYDLYKQTLENLGDNFFVDQGVEDYYYIAPTDNLILSATNIVQSSDEEFHAFEQRLRDSGASIDTLQNRSGQDVFHIYHFTEGIK